MAVLRSRKSRQINNDQADGDSELSPVVGKMLGTANAVQRRLRIPPRADQPGRVPSPGVLSVVGVDLPSGRPTRPVKAARVEFVTTIDAGSSEDDLGAEQLWVATREGGADRRWKLLAAGFAQSGLWPVLLPPPPEGSSYHDEEWFDQPALRHGIEQKSAAQHIRMRIAESLEGGSPLSATDLLKDSAAAQGTLTRGTGRRLDAIDAACTLIGDARLGLAPGRRPADILHAIAWPGAEAAHIPSAELAQILGSWEERWGTILVGLDELAITLAVMQPPATQQEAVEALAELHALCPDQADDWPDDYQGAQALIDEPVWRLSWH